MLRAYLKRWRWEVGAFFGGVGPDSSDEDLRAQGGSHPVLKLRLTPAHWTLGAQRGSRTHSGEV